MSYYPNVAVTDMRCLNLSGIRKHLTKRRSSVRSNPPTVERLPQVSLLGSSTKVAHSLREGWENAVMYLAPHSRAEGANMCVFAGKCQEGCLTSAGQLGMAPAEVSKIFKTRVYQADQNMFLNLLIADIARFLNKIPNKEAKYIEEGKLPSKAKGGKLMPTVRLNGTSDEPWEIIPVVIMPELIPVLNTLAKRFSGNFLVSGIQAGATYRNIFEVFPKLQFYDYTKYRIRTRMDEYSNFYGLVPWPRNYHLTYSLSEQAQSEAWAKEALMDGFGVAAVYNTKVKEVEAARKIQNGDAPEKKTEASLMKRLRKQKGFYGWQIILGSIPVRGLGDIQVVNADVTDLRFKDGTDSRGYGKIAWLSSKGAAIRDCTGFVRDYATVQAMDFGQRITSFEPWAAIGEEGGCRRSDLDPKGPISGVKTADHPYGSLTMKFPYMTWEQALVDGRSAKTKFKYDKPLTAKEKAKNTKGITKGRLPPRFDWGRIEEFARRGACVYGGTVEGLIMTILIGSPHLYNGPLPMVEENKDAIAASLVEEVIFIMGSGAASKGLSLFISQNPQGKHDLFVGKGDSMCPPPLNWRSKFKASRAARTRSLLPGGVL